MEDTLSKYNYEFPQNLIAQKPASPRDSAKLLIYDRTTKEVISDTYKNLTKYIPKNSVLVLNQTKVIPARLEVTKPTGGKVKLLYIKKDNQYLYFLSDKKLSSGTKLSLNRNIKFEVLKKTNHLYILKPNFPVKRTEDILTRFGITPLPPYIKHSPLRGKNLLKQYNTVFAKYLGSVAAPTASLHFTNQLLNRIRKSGVSIKFITLHVNLGTFASVTPEQVKHKKLHSEYYEIDSATATFLNKAKKSGRPIIAVGTTVTRALESAANRSGQLKALTGETTLFIQEQTKLKFVDCLLTNFHVPKSSLLMLVSAFVGRVKLLALYEFAIKNKYRLFSFGDGMLVK